MKTIPVICVMAVTLASLPDTADCATDVSERADLQLRLDDMRTFSDVYNLVRVNYVEPVGDRDLLNSALRGMLAELDPYSEYLPPRQAQQQHNQARGQLGGIGIVPDIRDGRIFIGSVITDGPAHTAGIRQGDMILAVDGTPVRGRPLRESLAALEGEPDTEVLVRFDSGPVQLTRAFIPVASVYSELMSGRIAYLRLSHFHVNSAEEFEEALQGHTEAAGGGLDGIVLDLRGNGGGVVGSAIVIADGFLDDGLVVYTQGRKPESKVEFFAEAGQWAPGVPVAVLIDGQTASASEILAGALQDHDRATLVGEKSFGKGTVQTVLPLRNGSALKLTTSRYFTPLGRSINASGISPDLVASTGRAATPEEDRALQVALAALRESAPGR